MRLRVLILTTAALLVGCSHLVVGHTKVFGSTHEVSIADVQAVVDAFETKRPDLKAYQVEVINKDEMRVYWYTDPPVGSCEIFRREAGRWHYDSAIIVTS